MAIVLFPTYLQRVRWQLSVKYCRKRTWDRVSLWKTVSMALKQAAAFYRQQLNIRVVGITGSVGKTSTKEFVAVSACTEIQDTQDSRATINNEIGRAVDDCLPCRRMTEAAVVEMGINTFRGDAPFKRDGQAGYLRDDKYRSVPSGISLVSRDGILRRQNPRFLTL